MKPPWFCSNAFSLHTPETWLQVFALTVAFSFTFMPLAMFCSIFRNAVSNMTTYERSNRSTYPHLRGGNPFDQGLVFNLKEFFGMQCSRVKHFSPQMLQVLAALIGAESRSSQSKAWIISTRFTVQSSNRSCRRAQTCRCISTQRMRRITRDCKCCMMPGTRRCHRMLWALRFKRKSKRCELQ
jgi:hypothetical protein